MSGLRGMSQQAKGNTPNVREVVRIDDPLGIEPAPASSTSTSQETTPQSTEKRAVKVSPLNAVVSEQLEQDQKEPPTLDDLLAQVMQSMLTSGEDLDEELPLDGKVTIYFEPSQMEKLLEIRKRFKGSHEQMPNMQNIMRFLVEKIPPEFFDDFPKYMYEKRMQKMRVQLEKRVGKLTRETRAQLKGLFPD